jgi:ATP-binding cassette subfamily C protein CydC
MKQTLKDIRPFLQPFAGHLRAMALATAMGLVAVAAAVGLLALSGWFITAAALAGATAAGAAGFNFFYPSIGVRLFAFARTLARYAERVFSHDATFRILSDLRSHFYRRIEPAAPAALMPFQSGDILQRVVGDIDTLDHLYLRLASPCVIAAFTLVGLTAFLGWIDVRIALSGLAFFVFAGLGVSVLAGRLGAGAGASMTAAAARLRIRVVEGAQAMAELLAHNAHRGYRAQIDRDQQVLISAQRRMNRISAASGALVSAASGAGALTVLWLACPLAADDRMHPAVVALAVFALLAVFEAVLPLPGAFQFLGRTRAAARRLSELLDPAAPVVFPAETKVSPVSFDLLFEKIGFRYGPRLDPVFDDLTLHIPSARRAALLGPTGAGKSSLVHLLCRFWDPDRGRICIGGADIAGFADETLRKTVAVVSQRDHVFSATLRENLVLARPGASDAALYKALAAVGLDAFAQSLPHGLDTWIGEGGRGLSGGQARRLFIARAVVADSPIWVLDEPTEGLDSKTEAAVFDALFSLTEGKTVLVITHRPVLIDRFDQVAVLEKGRIVEIGRHRELLAEGGRYPDLVGQI